MKRTNLKGRVFGASLVIGLVFIGILATVVFACVIGQCDLCDVLSSKAGWVLP